MEKVPEIITTKDLDYLNDIFNWNFTAAKKAYHFKGEVKNEEIKEELTEVYKAHKEICNKIINIIQGE